MCHVRGPLRNKTATLVHVVIFSRSDSDHSADLVPGQTMLPTVSLTESDIPRAFLKPSIHFKRLRVCQTRSSLLLAALLDQELDRPKDHCPSEKK